MKVPYWWVSWNLRTGMMWKDKWKHVNLMMFYHRLSNQIGIAHFGIYQQLTTLNLFVSIQPIHLPLMALVRVSLQVVSLRLCAWVSLDLGLLNQDFPMPMPDSLPIVKLIESQPPSLTFPTRPSKYRKIRPYDAFIFRILYIIMMQNSSLWFFKEFWGSRTVASMGPITYNNTFVFRGSIPFQQGLERDLMQQQLAPGWKQSSNLSQRPLWPLCRKIGSHHPCMYNALQTHPCCKIST